MLCEKCGKREAEVHVKQVFNQQVRECNFCRECAKESGHMDILKNSFDGFFSFNGDDLNMFFNPLLKKDKNDARQERCPGCSRLYKDFAGSAKAGCAQCYTTFFAQMTDIISGFHHSLEHTGKIAKNAGKDAKKRNMINKLKLKLEEAVKNEEYEVAAKLRDEIKSLKGGE